MAVTTSQQITRYYTQFEAMEVTFTREVVRALMLDSKHVFIKCLGFQWPCIIYSSSMVGAKIITNMNKPLKDALQKSKNVISVRFSFVLRDKPDPLAFFVAARIAGMSPYGDPEKGLNFLNVVYTQRPPDDLIERLGSILEASAAFQKRRDERIIMSPDTAKRLGFLLESTRILVDKVPRKAIIRDISFGGAKVIMHGIPQFLLNKPTEIRLECDDPREVIVLTGTIVRFEPVADRTDIAAFAIQYADAGIPMPYKMRLNEHLRRVKIGPQDGASA